MRAMPIAPSAVPAAGTVTASPLGGDELRDIKDVLPLSHGWPWWYWLIGAVLLAVTLYLLHLVKIRRKKSPNTKKPAPDQAALQAIDRALLLAGNGEAREFAVLVTDILRQYIEARFQLGAPALTTREFLLSVAGGGQHMAPELASAANRLADILHDCDRAKFAAAPLSARRMKKIAGQAAAFIRSTRPGGEGGA